MHPGAAEVCGNGLDDDCSQAPGEPARDCRWSGTYEAASAPWAKGSLAVITDDANDDGIDDLTLWNQAAILEPSGQSPAPGRRTAGSSASWRAPPSRASGP